MEARRVGALVVAWAVVARLVSAGVPGRLWALVDKPGLAAFALYLETGRKVSVSPVLGAFSPDFAESPPPSPTEKALPVYTSDPQPEIYNAAGRKADTRDLLSTPLTWNLYGDSPTVLILHTHATESYTRHTERYAETAPYRTLDEEYNLLHLGSLVAEGLTAAGIPTLQDRTLHDYPSYNGSYVHARANLKALLKENPTIRLVLDLHRDAVEVSYGQLHTRCDLPEGTAAQIMLVVGTNHDGWRENLSLALKLHAQLERQATGLTRPLQLRGQRFNQDLTPGCLLVELGAAGNTRKEAELAAMELVKAVIALANGTGAAGESVDSG